MTSVTAIKSLYRERDGKPPGDGEYHTRTYKEHKKKRPWKKHSHKAHETHQDEEDQSLDGGSHHTEEAFHVSDGEDTCSDHGEDHASDIPDLPEELRDAMAEGRACLYMYRLRRTMAG